MKARESGVVNGRCVTRPGLSWMRWPIVLRHGARKCERLRGRVDVAVLWASFRQEAASLRAWYPREVTPPTSERLFEAAAPHLDNGT